MVTYGEGGTHMEVTGMCGQGAIKCRSFGDRLNKEESVSFSEDKRGSFAEHYQEKGVF